MQITNSSSDWGSLLFWLFVGLCVQVAVIYFAVRLAIGPLISAARDPHWSITARRENGGVEFTLTNAGPGSAFAVEVRDDPVAGPVVATSAMLGPGSSAVWRRGPDEVHEGVATPYVRWRKDASAGAGSSFALVSVLVPPGSSAQAGE